MKTAVVLFILATIVGCSQAVTVNVCLTFADTFGQSIQCGGATRPHTCGTNWGYTYTDASGFATVTQMDITWTGAIICDTTQDFYINDGAYLTTFTLASSCSCSGTPSAPATATITTLADLVLGGSNTLEVDQTNCNGPDGAAACLTSFDLTGSVTGGGGDPHLFSPFLHAEGVELFRILDHVSRLSAEEGLRLRHFGGGDEEEAVAPATSSNAFRMVDTADVIVNVQTTTPQYHRERHYFTGFSVLSAASSLAISQAKSDGGDLHLAFVQTAADGSTIEATAACQRGAEEFFGFSLSDDVTVEVECNSGVHSYSRNLLMSHELFAGFQGSVQARVTILSAEAKLDTYYMQPEYRDGVWTAHPFGYFNVHVAPVNGGHYHGLFGNVADEEIHARMADRSDADADAHFVASHVLPDMASRARFV